MKTKSWETSGVHKQEPDSEFFSNFWYQGGVKSTVSGVFEDLKSAKLRQPTGQSQENFNFACSILKF